MFENSILVVAHPDDEILWFSSVIQEMNEVIITFMDVPSKPVWSTGRRASIPKLPINNLSCLNVVESEAFNAANWIAPEITEFGLNLTETNNIRHREKYVSNFTEISNKLQPILGRYDNVFTHNPWGEYGHEEHVQLYRTIKSLQAEGNYNIWFSNYCSNKSFNLMQNYMSGFQSDYITRSTEINLAHQFMHIYKENQCWTWYDEYQWFKEENFMQDSQLPEITETHGSLFPVNMLKIEMPVIIKQTRGLDYVGKKIRNRINKYIIRT